MKKRLLAVLITGLFLLCMTGMANAGLITIGTAQYGSSAYNLIWDDDNNGNSVVWLDYTNDTSNWTAHNAWAAGLDSSLIYNIDSAYTVAWDDAAWRLPSAGADPHLGHNQTTSEMGDLFYNDLGASPVHPNIYTTVAQLNATNFDNLISCWYWSGTEYTDNTDEAWLFGMYDGYQHRFYKYGGGYGLVVRSGQVSANPVPEPATILLFSTGLAGLTGFRRWRKGNRV